MDLTHVDELGAFDALRPQWDELRRADPHATVFLSSAWLRAFLATSPTAWTIAALREGDRLVAAFPFSIRGAPHPRLPIARELTFASAPFADYQGMLCRPEHETAAIDTFATFLRTLPWERASFPDVRDPRIRVLAERLSAGGASLRELPQTPCSALDLPPTWDAFLARLSKPTRRSTVRPMKGIVEKLPRSRLTEATDATVDAHIDAVLQVHALRWGSTADRTRKYRRLLRAAHDQGCMDVTVVWDGERAFAVGVSFLDRERGVYGAYIVDYDPAYARFSPGKAVLAAGVHRAISAGFRTFDFMRGDESYKTSYATQITHNRHYEIARPVARTALLRAALPLYAAVRSLSVRLRLRRHAA